MVLAVRAAGVRGPDWSAGVRGPDWSAGKPEWPVGGGRARVQRVSHDRVLCPAPGGRHPSGAARPWDERLTALASAYRGVAQRHPWSAQLLFSRPSVTPDAVRVTESIYAALREAGVPEAHVGRLERLVSTFVVGYAASEVLGRFTDRALDLDAEFEADLADLLVVIEAAARGGA